MIAIPIIYYYFFYYTAPNEIYTLSLHDALPISRPMKSAMSATMPPPPTSQRRRTRRSEEHTSELQSRRDLVCRLLLEKKKTALNSIDYATIYLAQHYCIAFQPRRYNISFQSPPA